MSVTIQTPRTENWREYQRFLQNQAKSIGGVQASINIGPMRELIPQLGPIRRTDGITGSGPMPVGSAIVYVPFVINADYWDVNAFYWAHETFGNNNVCVAIYSEAGSRLVTTGTVATDEQMEVAISPAVRLTRARYWLAFGMSGTTDTVYGYAGVPYGNDVIRVISSGIKYHVHALPLEATATFGTPVATIIPAVYVGIASP